MKRIMFILALTCLLSACPFDNESDSSDDSTKNSENNQPSSQDSGSEDQLANPFVDDDLDNSGSGVKALVWDEGNWDETAWN